MRRLASSSAVAALLALAGCAAPASVLVVDVRTDYVPQVDFTTIEVEVHGGDSFDGPGIVHRTQPRIDDAGPNGIRAAELELPAGSYRVRARLLAPDGVRVAERRAVTELVGLRVVVLIASRSCRDTRCPMRGEDPGLTECVDGVCVPPSCLPDDPGGCGGARTCEEAESCPIPSPCAEAECVGGLCAPRARHDLCAEGEYCDADAGCRPRPPPCSEETCVGHPCEIARCVEGSCTIRSRCRADEHCCAGMCVALDCDDGDPCTADSCGAAGCEHAPLPDGGECDDGVFCNGADACAAGSCSVHAGDPCSGSAHCDEAAHSCTNCEADDHCGPPRLSAWSACGGFSDPLCDEVGTRERARRTFRCEARTCVWSDDTVQEACTRETEGFACGPNGRECRGGSCECPGGSSEWAAPAGCTNGLDDDCNGLIDCADAGCVGRPCDDLDPCTSGEQCLADGTCRDGVPGLGIRECVSGTRGSHYYITEDNPTLCDGSWCGLSELGIAWRVPAGGTMALYELARDARCGSTSPDLCADFVVSRGSTGGPAGAYCLVAGLGTTYYPVTGGPPGTVPLYRHRNTTTGVSIATLEATPPAGFVPDTYEPLLAYVCPP